MGEIEWTKTREGTAGENRVAGFFFGHEPIAKLYVSTLYKRVTYISSSYTSISTAPEHHSGGLQ